MKTTLDLFHQAEVFFFKLVLFFLPVFFFIEVVNECICCSIQPGAHRGRQIDGLVNASITALSQISPGITRIYERGGNIA